MFLESTVSSSLPKCLRRLQNNDHLSEGTLLTQQCRQRYFVTGQTCIPPTSHGNLHQDALKILVRNLVVTQLDATTSSFSILSNFGFPCWYLTYKPQITCAPLRNLFYSTFQLGLTKYFSKFLDSLWTILVLLMESMVFKKIQNFNCNFSK